MKAHLQRTLRLATLAIGAVSVMPTAFAVTPRPTSWELAGEFDISTNNNASLVWQYGRKPWTGNTGPVSFIPMLTKASPCLLPQYTGNFEGWITAPCQTLPLVGQNLNTIPWTTPEPPPSNITLPGRGLQLHPGPPVPTKKYGMQCKVATVRFTAPYPAQYRVSGQFYGLDGNGGQTHTKVYIVSKTPSSMPVVHYNGVVNATMPTQIPASFTSKLVQLNQNETLDFDVGCGGDNNDYYAYGSTGLHTVIEYAGPYCDLPECQHD